MIFSVHEGPNGIVGEATFFLFDYLQVPVR
jgi:hypothetical protein